MKNACISSARSAHLLRRPYENVSAESIRPIAKRLEWPDAVTVLPKAELLQTHKNPLSILSDPFLLFTPKSAILEVRRLSASFLSVSPRDAAQTVKLPGNQPLSVFGRPVSHNKRTVPYPCYNSAFGRIVTASVPVFFFLIYRIYKRPAFAASVRRGLHGREALFS